MNVQPSPSNDEQTLVINRGRVKSFDLYEVKENELELLEKGSTANHEFGFGVFLLSTAITCLAALGTTDFKWQIVQQICIFLTLIGFILGAFFMMSWWRIRKSVKEVVLRIKDRIPPTNTRQTVETPELLQAIEILRNALAQREADNSKK